MARYALLFFLIALLLLGVAVGALFSPAGTRLLVRQAESLLDPALSIEGVSGSLLQEVCAERLEYRHERAVVAARNLCVDVNLWASLDFLEVSLKSLRADAVEVRTLPAPAEAEPGGAPSLPLAIGVERIGIGELAIDTVTLSDLRSSLALANSDLVSDSRFLFDGDRVRLLTAGPWRAFRAELSALGGVAAITVDLLQEALPYRIRVDGDQVDVSRYAGRALVLGGVRVAGEGDLAGYRLEAAATVSDPLASGRLALTGSGDWNGLRLDRLEATGVRSEGLPLVVQNLSGRADLDWRPAFRLRLEAVQSDGDYDGRRLSVRLGELVTDGSALTISDGELRPFAPGSVSEALRSIRVAGQLTGDRHLDLGLEALAVPLELVDERLTGDLDARLTISGPLDDPGLDGDYELSDLEFGGVQITRLGGTLNGTRESGALTLALSSEQAEADSSLRWRQRPEGIRIDVDRAGARLAATPVGALGIELTDPLAVDLVGGGVTTSPACLRITSELPGAQPAAICGSATYPDGPASLTLEPWPLPEADLLNGKVRLTGGVAGTLLLESFAPLIGEAALSLEGLAAHQDGQESLNLGAVDVRLSAADGELRIALDSPADQDLRLSGALESTLASPLPDTPLAGRVAVALDGIWAAESLLPMDLVYELDGVRGLMTLHGEIAGTLGSPSLGGTLELEDVGFRVLALNMPVEGVGLEAKLENADRLAFTSQGSAGGGSLAVSGVLEGLEAGGLRLASELTLTGARVVDLPDYSALVDGAIVLTMTGETLGLTGDIKVPSAAVRIADLPATAVSVSADEVIVGAETPSQQVRTTDLRLSLGDDVVLDAFGLETKLSGSLRYRETPGRLPEVTGGIALKGGDFEAYGQILKVERGQLTFTGPMDDPLVDVLAVRTVSYEGRDYRISLHISGSAQNLKTAVLSTPSLPEDDALALLITGRTFSQATSSEQTDVYGAALSLGLMGASGITRSLAAGIGVEEIILDKDTEGNVEVGAALRLNQDLYLRYTYGVFSRLGGVLLRYHLSDRISVQAKTGDAHSIEIRYGVD